MSFLKEVLRGIAIGVANIIPGVSGGPMMVSMGIYGDVIGAVTGMPKHFWKSVKFLLPYAIGMLIGIGGLSFAIGYFFLEFPFETAMLFIGLIFGGVPLLLPKIMGKRITFSETLLFVLFFGLVVWMQFWKQGTDVALEPGIKNSISLFVVGTVAAATMVIPGVSGSMLLMSLGYYTPIINRISGFLAALPALKWEELFACAAVLIPFGIGVVLGIFLVSKLVEYLLKKQERKTYFAIMGLVTSSPIAVLSGMNIVSIGFGQLLLGILLFIGGFFIANILGK